MEERKGVERGARGQQQSRFLSSKFIEWKYFSTFISSPRSYKLLTISFMRYSYYVFLCWSSRISRYNALRTSPGKQKRNNQNKTNHFHLKSLSFILTIIMTMFLTFPIQTLKSQRSYHIFLVFNHVTK